MTDAPTDPRTDGWKAAAARAAVAEVADGMIVGLGTGSTAAHAVDALGERVAQGLSVQAVATSQRTALHAARAGIRLLDMADVAQIDLCIDGVDEIDPAFRAIKGAGGAMLREKIVASAARRMVAIADASKSVARLGTRPLPLEVLPLAHAFVLRQIALLGCEAVLRRDEQGDPVPTDQGNIILDCHHARAILTQEGWPGLARHLDAMPGVMGHGLFLHEIDALYLGTADGAVRTDRPV